MEAWKPLNPEKLYWVSSEGRVWAEPHVTRDGRTYSGRIVKCCTSPKDGYVRFNYRTREGKGSMTLHRAVALAFIPNPEGKPEINHINGNKQDNRHTNLEWVTPSENQAHALATGLRKLNVPSRSTRIGRYDADGTLESEYPSVAEASRSTQIPAWTLYRACGSGKPIHGYTWHRL